MGSGSGWERIYPGKRIVTLILDPFEAEELLGQALAEGRRIGERTVLGMPMIAFSEPRDGAGGDARSVAGRPVDPVDLDNWRALGRGVEHHPDGQTPEPDDKPDDKPENKPDNKVVILPVIRREPLPDKPQEPPAAEPPVARQLADPPQPPARPKRQATAVGSKRESSKRISAADQALIDEAIAQGRVTKCPDFKHSVEPGQLLPGEGWRKGKKGKGKKSRS